MRLVRGDSWAAICCGASAPVGGGETSGSEIFYFLIFFRSLASVIHGSTCLRKWSGSHVPCPPAPPRGVVRREGKE